MKQFLGAQGKVIHRILFDLCKHNFQIQDNIKLKCHSTQLCNQHVFNFSPKVNVIPPKFKKIGEGDKSFKVPRHSRKGRPDCLPHQSCPTCHHCEQGITHCRGNGRTGHRLRTPSPSVAYESRRDTIGPTYPS